MKRLDLTSSQKARLESELRNSINTQTYRRAAALLALNRGTSATRLATLLGVSRQSIYNWLETYTNRGDDLTLTDAPRSGRPSVWTTELHTYLEETLRKTPGEVGSFGTSWTLDLLCAHLTFRSGKRFSTETLRRRLGRLGYIWKDGRYVQKS
jgi:transposase